MAAIVLHHGLFGAGSFRGIERALGAEGHRVFISTVHPTASIKTRARQLREWMLPLQCQLGRQKMTIIAHSMGGLDARYMLAKMEMDRHVEALVTISTPHRGSAYADFCCKHVGKRLRAFEVVRRFGIDVAGIGELTLESCGRFNEDIRDVPGVKYFSVSAARRWQEMPAFGIPSWYIVNRLEGANDGQVSVASAKWGKHLGTWKVDHWHAINQRYGLTAIKEGDISPRYVALVREIDPGSTIL